VRDDYSCILRLTRCEKSGGFFFGANIPMSSLNMTPDDLEQLRDEGKDILTFVMQSQDCSFPEAVEQVTAWLIAEILGVDVEKLTLH
jgi:hypothetical protein